MNAYQVLEPKDLEKLHSPNREFGLAVLEGLSEIRKTLPSKYLYDDHGSELFQQIMGVEEYYPTDCEREILETHNQGIVDAVSGIPLNVVDLGAGDGAKTLVLLKALTKAGVDFKYVPIDISEGALQSLVPSIRKELPNIHIDGLVCDYTDGLKWLGQQEEGRRNLALFLGSNLGNMSKAASRSFVRRLWNELQTDDFVFIGFDLKKDIDVMLDAYNDASGVTAEFNLNLLTRINRELNANFDRDAFRHYGTYDVFSGAMHSYLVSLKKQDVYVGTLETSFHFDAWEPIRTEYSYKFLRDDINELAQATGFSVTAEFEDARGYFVDSLWTADKRRSILPPAL